MTDTATKKSRGRPSKNKPVDEKKSESVSANNNPQNAVKRESEKTVKETVEKPKKVEPLESDVKAQTKTETSTEKENFVDDIENENEDNMTKDFDIDDAEIVNEEYSPLNDEVIHRGYESGSAQMAQTSIEEGLVIPEAQLTFSDENQAEAEKKKNATGNTTGQPNGQQPNGQAQPNTQGGSQVSKTEVKSQEKSHFTSDHSKSTESSTESKAEKRRNAIKMADTLLMVYRENVPVLFKYFAQFNEGKISQMELDGELDRTMPVLADGTTAGDYIAQVNKQVDATFVITDTQVEEVREPLIDWLMEKDLKLTPSQRLAMAIGSQMVSFGLATLKQWQSNRHALNKFAEFHADWKGHGKGDVPHQRHRNDVQDDYAPTEEVQPRQEQRQNPNTTMSNISDLDGAESDNMMPESDEPEYTVENDTPSDDLNMDDYMNQPSNDDIPK